MKLLRRCVALALAAAVLAPAWAAKEMGPRQRRAAVEDAEAGRVIVKYRADSALMRPLSAQAAPRPQHAAALGLRLGLPLVDGRELGARTQGLRSQGITSDELQRRLAQQPEVEWAVIDRRRVALAAVPNDPYYGPNQTGITPAVGQWYLRAPDTTIVSAINAVGGWAVTQGSASITVAVLDTGVRFDHPDLQNKLYAGYDFINDITTAGDGNGRDSDASDPGDYTSSSASCGAGSSSWHGTQTAGIVGAASDNSVGMASVGRNVMVLPVRVLGKCGGYDSDIIAGMRWAAGVTTTPTANAHPAKVINMSLGSSGSCDSAYTDVFNELVGAGVSIVVAAGNETGRAVGTPANCPGAIAVGGLRHIGTKVGFSDVGPEITISAPGGNCVNETGACLYPILTTTNAGTTTPSTNTYSDSYDYSVGTSFSSPMVAGAIGLMLSVDSSLSPANVKAILQSTARAFPTSGSGTDVQACHAPNSSDQIECYCTTTTCGAGMLNVAGAVTLPPQATVALSNSSPTAGNSVTLTAQSPAAFAGRTVASYQWAITAGDTLAAFSGATDAATATLATSAAGTVTVQLTITDSTGLSTVKSTTMTVQAASSGGGGGGGGGDSGGGAMSAAWLAGLLAAVLALAWAQRR